MTTFSPREIVSELDRFIIGQKDAKRAVAIALRNRWRRQQLDGQMREEVMPKNILMIGPTGVGKTEIARRLANSPVRRSSRSKPPSSPKSAMSAATSSRSSATWSKSASGQRGSASARMWGQATRPTCRRGARARCPGRRQCHAGDARVLPQEAARRRARRQGNRDRDAGLRRHADVRNPRHARRADGRDLDRRHLRQGSAAGPRAAASR